MHRSFLSRSGLRYASVCNSVVWLLLLGAFPAFGVSQDAPRLVDVEADWKRPDYEGEAEYRAWVFVPAAWREEPQELFLEAADDARQTRLNGQLVAEQGSLPPAYRSGLGETGRFAIPAEAVRFGDWNQLTIRVFRRASRDNFNVAAPAWFAGDEAIRLRGAWWRVTGQFAKEIAFTEKQRAKARYEDRLAAAEVASTLQKLADESGPRTPGGTLDGMTTADGLQAQVALAEPEIGQPLSLKFDERGRIWVAEYRQYPNPAGLKMVSRDKYLRTVYDKVPPAPPHHDRGADRITIHEDRDRDGTYETHKTFLDGLNMATSFALGRDGVFVLHPPYLLFYADADHDDQPDGPPEVLLEGFGLEDTHSLTNSLRWGPDGWLYATQGSTVSGAVRRPAAEEATATQTMGQLVWRYHPVTRQYEVFAEGGGNAFGVEFDRVGRVYSGHNGGNTRGFHYVQGGYFQKSFGKHGALSNPFTFGYFSWMKHHSAPRFSHTFVIYEGGAFPAPFNGRLFGVEPLQSRVIMSEVTADGSTFQTQDVGYAMTNEDVWVRPVDIQLGPDGALYVADFYEQRIDHSSHYQGRVDVDSGRVYRLSSTQQEAHPRLPDSFDLRQHSHEQLADLLNHPNRWFQQTALRLLADRAARQAGDRDLIDRELVDTALATVDGLGIDWSERLASEASDTAVGYLWAWHLTDQLTDTEWLQALEHQNPHVRRWAVRLLGDRKQVDVTLASRLLRMAQEEQDVEVRSQLASSARRLQQSLASLWTSHDSSQQPTELNLPAAASLGLGVATRLTTHDEDLTDPHLPLLIWWVFEARAEADRSAIVQWVGQADFVQRPLVEKFLLPKIMRRYAATGRRVDLETCGELLSVVPSEAGANALLKGFDAAFAGRLMSSLPEKLLQGLARYRGESLELRLQQGDATALPEVHRRLLKQEGTAAQRLTWVQLLGQLASPDSLEVLWQLATDEPSEELRAAAWQALRAYGNEPLAERILPLYVASEPAERRAMESLLVSRPAWARRFLQAIAADEIHAQSVAAETVDTMSLLPDPQVQERMATIWGTPAATSAEALEQRIEQYQAVLAQATGNPYTGRELYAEHCGRCHRLFNEGGDIGPDLTSYQRDDPYRTLANVLSPSREIREGYETTLVVTIDGLTVTGFVADRDPQHLVIRQSDGQSVVIPQEDIEESIRVDQSVMPEGLLDELSEQEIRDLFAYLRSAQPLPQ